MRKLILATVLGLATIVTLPAYAVTATGNFNVVINLISKCEINSTNAATGAVINDVVFDSYTSFQAAPLISTGGGFEIRCTKLLPYTVALSDLGVIDDAVELAYVLSLSAVSGVGTGANQAFTVDGIMASGQSGTCPTATCTNAAATNKTKTVTIAW